MGRYEIEPSVQMRLYTLSKRHFVLVFATFFLCFGITVLIGLTGPAITEGSQINATTLVPKVEDLRKGPFVLQSPPVSAYHQQLWLIARITTDYNGDGKFEQPFDVGIKIRGMLEESGSNIVYSNIVHNRSRILRCSQKCDDLMLLHLGFLDYSRYIITVQFSKLQNMQYSISDIKFFFKTYNPAFTQLEIWFRFVFLLLTFLSTVLFAHSLRRFSVRDWSMEQRWMSVLLPLLLLYNNPLFPLTFLVNSWVPGMFDALFQATFLGTLLLFWLCLYHGVRQNKRRFCAFYLPKMVIVGLIWLTAVTLSSWQKYSELQDPTYNYRTDTANFMAFKVFFFIVGGIYLLYLVYLLVRAYAELRYMPYFDLRLKFMTALMLIVLAISITIMVLRFGVGELQDNLMSEMSTHYQNSAEFLSFYGLLNFYLYTMAFVYSPSKNAAYESHFKDNPALSMLNDSDDDVIYGSDLEGEVALTRKVRPVDSEEEAFN